MKDIFLLHDSARAYINLRTREESAKMLCTALPFPAYGPDQAQSGYYLFGPVKYLCGRYFADDNKLKQSFRDVIRCRHMEFCNFGVQCFTQRW
jgi:hypothetical protein